MRTPSHANAYLLDIDGTLLTSSSGHLAALAAVLADRIRQPVAIVMRGERPMLDDADLSGYVDAQLVRHVFDRRLGVRPDRATMDEVMAEYGERFAAYLERGGQAGRPVPGAAAFLDRCATAGVALGLVTGNLSTVAQAKLGAVGLARYFHYGPDLGFGDWRANRDEVAAAALDAMRVQVPDGLRCAMVGDTDSDMRAASRLGIAGIGVLSGASAADALLGAGATRIVASIAAL